MAASISAPGKRAHTFPALDRSQDQWLPLDCHLFPCQPLPRDLFHLRKWRSSLCFVVVAARCWCCHWWMRRDDAEKEEQVAANVLPKILCPKQLQMWIKVLWITCWDALWMQYPGSKWEPCSFCSPLQPLFPPTYSFQESNFCSCCVIIQKSTTKYIK